MIIKTLLLVIATIIAAFWIISAWVYTLIILMESEVYPGIFGFLSGVFERTTSKGYGKNYLLRRVGGILSFPLLFPIALSSSLAFWIIGYIKH